MKIAEIFPEINEIKNQELREKTAKCLEMGREKGGWSYEDLDNIPFTLLIPNCPVSLVKHTRAIAKLSMKAYELFTEDYSEIYKLDRDLLISGALLHDVGKMVEYKLEGGKFAKSDNGKLIRHPFSGANLAAICDLPDEVVHMIAVHAHEGDSGYRSPEARIINHADFMNFEPLRDLLK